MTQRATSARPRPSARRLGAAAKSGVQSGAKHDLNRRWPSAPAAATRTATNCIVTSHIASRTHESVGRQAGMATSNLIKYLQGEEGYVQANKF